MMHSRFAWVCMYVCISADCAMQLEKHNHKLFKYMPRSVRIAYDFSNAFKIHFNVCQVCCPLNDQIR